MRQNYSDRYKKVEAMTQKVPHRSSCNISGGVPGVKDKFFFSAEEVSHTLFASQGLFEGIAHGFCC